MSALAISDMGFVCPVCRTVLISTMPETFECPACSLIFRKSPEGSYDFREGQHFMEWFAAEAESQSLSAEELGSAGIVDRYLVPLLRARGLNERSKILSDGCGIGADVERLRYYGFDAWGIDPGEGRGSKWKDRTCRDFLIHGSGTDLPFADNTFDFVFSEGVIEHVGLTGDSNVGEQLLHKTALHAARQRYIIEMLRVLTPGGTALVAGPNRVFPIDFFHGGKSYGPLTMAWHKPGQGINSAWRDIAAYLQDHPEVSMKFLSLHRFFNTHSLASRGSGWAVLAGIVDFGFASTPKRVMSSIGPYFAVTLTKGERP